MPLPKTEKELEAKIAELEARLEEMSKKSSSNPTKSDVIALLQEVRDELKKLNAPKAEPKKEEAKDDDDWFK
jgi:DNA-binding transcriptional MerR regulator